MTAVVPFWLVNTPDSDITTMPLGKNGEQGLEITVNGQEYAGYVTLLIRWMVANVANPQGE